MTDSTTRTPSAPPPPRSRPIIVEVRRPEGTPRGRSTTPSGGATAAHPPHTTPAGGGPPTAPWHRLAVVGMVPPLDTVDLGTASPLYRADVHPEVHQELRGAYLLGPSTPEGVTARVWWQDGAPPDAATLFVHEPPRAPGGQPLPADAPPGVLYDDWSPREGCTVAVIRSSMWRMLRHEGVNPPWWFHTIGVLHGHARCRVAFVDRAAFHAWRRALGWGALAGLRPALLRATRAGDFGDDRATVYRVQRLAFDVFPQYTRDRAAVRALTVLTSAEGEARDKAIASLRKRHSPAEAADLLGVVRAWMVGTAPEPAGLDAPTQGARVYAEGDAG